MTSTAIVTGANSGIGHAFAKILIKQGYEVHAIDITVGEQMQKLGCKTYQCDLRSESSIQFFAERFAFAEPFKEKRLDLLLNIAGVMASPEEDALTTTTYSTLLKTFSTNTFGPLLLTQALLPSLLLSPHPRIGLMSSRVGSISDNSSGGSYAYRASKAALNSVGKSMAVDLKEKGVVVVLMHPGFVKTGILPSERMEQVKEAVEPEEAAEKLWKLLMEKGIEDSGRFWHREGMELPW